MSSSVHIDNKWKNILILGYGQTQRLPDDTLTPEAKYSINFTQSNIKFCLSLHYNGNNSFYLLMLQKYINSKQMILKPKKYLLPLGNISKDFTATNMKKDRMK